MLGFFCDWCGKAYKPYPVREYGNTMAAGFLSKERDADKKEIPIGTKIVGEAWTSIEGRGEYGLRTSQICPDCYEAYLEFVKKRKEGSNDQA